MTKLKLKMITLCMLLTMCFAITCPGVAKADEEVDKYEPIQCGTNVYATLDELGTLTISGTGDMWDASTEYMQHYFANIADDIYKVKIEKGVTSIGSYAFFYNGYSSNNEINSIISVDISDTVTNIGEYAFYENYQLRKINIPGNVKTIERAAFYDSGLQSCTLNKGIEKIGENAFGETNLSSIIIPEGVTSIEKNAFSDIYALSNVVISKGVGVIKSGAFYKDESGLSIVFYDNNVVIAPGAFWGATIKADRGSTAEEYALNNDMSINYHQYTSTLTFNPNGGKVDVASKKITSENAYGSMPTPTRKGYRFLGWYTQANGGQKVNVDTLVTTRVNSTLYAHWKVNPIVTFKGNGGATTVYSKYVVYKEKMGSLPKATRKGYIFKGWYTAKSGGTKVTKTTVVNADNDFTLYAQWKKISLAKMSKPVVYNNEYSRMKVSYKKVSNAGGYEIRYALKSNMKSAKSVKTTSKTGKVITKLQKGKRYYVQVRAFRKDSTGKYIYGKWSAKASVKIKK